jgi:uncharacterized membrane protein
MFLFALLNYDMPAVFLTMLAVYCRVKGNEDWCAAALGMGAAAKIYPVFLIPLFLIGKKPRDVIKFGVIAAGVWLLINASFMLTDFQAWLFPYVWQTTRDPTTDGLPWIIWRYIGAVPATMFFPLLYLVTLGLIYRRTQKMGLLGRTPDTEKPLLASAVALLGSFLLANRIFSPQYALWLLPFLALLPSVSLRAFYCFDVPNVAVTLLLYGLMAQQPAVWIGLRVIRYAALVFLYFQALKPGNSGVKERIYAANNK